MDSPVKLLSYRQRMSTHIDQQPMQLRQSSSSSSDFQSSESSRYSTAVSSSDAEISSATQSPLRHRQASGGSRRSTTSSSLSSLFHKLSLRRSSTASSFDLSPQSDLYRHGSRAAGCCESSDEDTMLSRLKKKSKSVGNMRRKKKTAMRRQPATSDLMDAPMPSATAGYHGAAAAAGSSATLPSRSKSLDVLAEAVCQNCRLQSLAATDSGMGSMSLTAPTDSPLWLGWHSSETGAGAAAGGQGDSNFLAQTHLAQSNPDLLTADYAESPVCDEDDDDESYSVGVSHCKDCGCLFREPLRSSPNVRVEFEQDYMC
eukprot:scpid95482/ scgid35474/ 